jgi:hypothetical protein
VREVVVTSLRRIAQKHAGIVLKDVVAYRMRNPKVKDMPMGLHKFFSHAINLMELNLFLGIFQRINKSAYVQYFLKIVTILFHHY